MISEYLGMLRKRWLVAVLCVLVGLIAAGADIAVSPKQYTASVQIFVATNDTSDVNQLNSANTFIQARVQSYVSVASSPSVTGPVRSQLQLNETDKQLASKITADAPLNKVLINLHVTDTSAQRAADIANAVGQQFVTAVQDIESTTTTTSKGVSTTRSPVKLSVIHPAQVPSAPVAPRKTVILGVGLLAGLLVGFTYAVARERLDTRLHTSAEVEGVAHLPVIGVVPLDKAAGQTPIAFLAEGYSRRAEAFRQLRTNLQFVDVDSPPRVISVTSAAPADGKSSVAINLAVSLAETGFSVCLVDTDLRRPTIASTLGLQSHAGLTSLLVGKAELDDVLQEGTSGVSVVTCGPLPPNPSELLASRHFGETVHGIADRFDYVILDSAPLLPVADGAEVASVAQATVLVVRSGKTNRAFLTSSIESLHRVGGVVAGIVLNMAPTPRRAEKYDYYRAAADEAAHGASRSADAAAAAADAAAADAADAAAADAVAADAAAADAVAADDAATDAVAVDAVPEVVADPSQTAGTPNVRDTTVASDTHGRPASLLRERRSAPRGGTSQRPAPGPTVAHSDADEQARQAR